MVLPFMSSYSETRGAQEQCIRFKKITETFPYKVLRPIRMMNTSPGPSTRKRTPPEDECAKFHNSKKLLGNDTPGSFIQLQIVKSTSWPECQVSADLDGDRITVTTLVKMAQFPRLQNHIFH